MTSENTPEGADEAAEEVVPDYSRVGFRQLQALCKGRGLPGDGNSITLVERLKAWDAQHGVDVDLSAVEDDDPLGLDEDDEAPVSTEPGCLHPKCVLDHPHAGPAVLKSPVGGGEAASAPSPTGITYTGGGHESTGTVTSAAPAVVVVSAPDAAKGPPRSSGHGGRPDLTVKNGVVKVGEGHGAAEARGYRHEIPIGPRDITDNDHFTYLEEAHAAARAAGYVTKGGPTVGERIGYGTDADGRRTAIYQVSLKRTR